ncbi:MAG: sulfite reductase [Deltaproteobacteria bacterium CG12_big_fil_rev_8_21_14_0_65_43_10]|nr:MAG: sulfite reductase [Deltaproteobacteria bacterium CG2_30_43_15]PIQ46826.1 MAG: sulfite reductase [Deltaproteobacteria bacterium CG12_big_fil_rev_8_21_14_0_65_43_10]PIU85650.1 MAG: sulfite reductase [Deltaproteobacteria bacterium CG06_land_8_20_14_3_00_44_19]PIX24555.1 MAG: sulfite reductase [Deltaproteobacteria bacterium CG_4_8_14_3_um_filter_43_13]PIZ20170.1 MAG: sulfite reductase [Deltaproteobacteria bacterium CG_4_10_14_0_8_um_filter_43_12]PJB41552.1 MAG: sulfite reductase [Deltaprot
MKWSKEAQEALSRIPFFVRKRVRKRVEEEAVRCGAPEVSLEHVHTCQRRFLKHMEDEVSGYQVETCFGPSGCPNRAIIWDDLSGRLEKRLSNRRLRAFLKERIKGSLKIHHEFRVSISDCPNACSRPQIVDLGLIGSCRPRISDEVCSQCGACIGVCMERAISLEEDVPILDYARCLSCGKCLNVCLTGTLQEDTRGYRILVGGKLGRHPQLGRELPGIYGLEDTLNVFDRCLDYYQENCIEGERFGEILDRTGLDWLTRGKEGNQKK